MFGSEGGGGRHSKKRGKERYSRSGFGAGEEFGNQKKRVPSLNFFPHPWPSLNFFPYPWPSLFPSVVIWLSFSGHSANLVFGEKSKAQQLESEECLRCGFEEEPSDKRG
ncbi:hypothetical protein SLEP1_g26205 [Rubroshorea leprosula]|uniref:Uncharacterized protein n=1 Tax=Rubroshorea leprosula TaxID=152421 RepID=A0AAV5JVM9_9ROSI|nr:hypothetical protein SLEP1_g26205 [Rubroshorea leprosula]